MVLELGPRMVRADQTGGPTMTRVFPPMFQADRQLCYQTNLAYRKGCAYRKPKTAVDRMRIGR
jgi:hypothetical protein